VGSDLRADWRAAGWLGTVLLAVYLLTMAGTLTSGDGAAMYATTQALLTQRRLSIPQRPEAALGRNGNYYGKYGLGQSLAQAPFFLIGDAVRRLADAPDDRAVRFFVGMTNSFVTAACAVVLFAAVRTLRFSRGVAVGVGLAYGLATLAWPYAQADFSEPLLGLSLLGAFFALARYRRGGSAWWAFVAGTGAGLAAFTKPVEAVLLPALVLYLAWALYERWWEAAGRGSPRPRALLAGAAPPAALFLAPLVAVAAGQAALNLYRFGRITEFGYGAEPATGFTTPLLTGISSLLWAPGKGLLLFCAPAWLAPWGMALLARRREPGPGGRRTWPEAAAVLLLFAAQLLYFARWWAWHGDWSWGPRYLVVTVPFLLLCWAPLLEGWGQGGLRAAARRLAGALALAAGFLAAILGVSIDYGAYYSVVAHQLGYGVDVAVARYDPAFSPLRGHWWLLRSTLYDSFVNPPDRRANPWLWSYPWAESHPGQVPAAPERALGWRFWFAGLPERTPFVEYWSALLAWWLGLALVLAGRRLWQAGPPPPPSPPYVERDGEPGRGGG